MLSGGAIAASLGGVGGILRDPRSRGVMSRETGLETFFRAAIVFVHCGVDNGCDADESGCGARG